MIYILIEESYANNNRISLILDGISTIAKKKRLSMKVYKKVEELPNDSAVVIIICASLKWATDTIDKLNKKSIHPLIFGFQYIDTIYQYSGITLTYTKTMYQLTKYILQSEGGDTAFIGYNEDSLPDKLKLMGVKYATKEYGAECKNFKNKGNINACLDEYAKEKNGYRNVVCSNDSIAMYMRSFRPELLEGKKLCSCSGLKLSEYIENPHLTTRINYIKAGMQLAECYLFLLRNDEIYPIVMTLEMNICQGKKVISMKDEFKSNIIDSRRSIDFYGDKNIGEVENFDLMLLNCDEIDLKILKDMTLGDSYEQIAETYYLAPNTVKYRVRAMTKNAGVDSKKQLLAGIERYCLKF